MSQPHVPVFFRPEQVAARAEVQTSPSAAKPKAVVESWKRLGVPLAVHTFEPVTREVLATAHDRAYVDAVLDLEEDNGFYNRSAAVAASLPYTTGSFLAATLHVLRHGGAAASPTSGFHHACHDSGGGFCTFNGLAVAALRALAEGCRKLAILDCDAHFGDGTHDILSRTGHLERDVLHYTRGSPHYRGGNEQAASFLAHLPQLLSQWKDEGVELVLYQAGADPHVDDPVGCRFLTTAQLHERDRAVFQSCARLGLPVAWNLAGGYQESGGRWPASIRKVLNVHDNTLRACAEAFVR
ncbi:MAG: histone deacetylase [Deltaproteobacteria bacterium]|nr:histone deacetylase [Deltaproteobacteria bacterium]